MSTTAETPVRTIATRKKGWSRFLLFALALHIPLFAYPVVRLCGWLELDWWMTTVIFLPLFFSQVIARTLLRRNKSFWGVGVKRGADLWLGISPVVVTLLLCFEVIVLATDLPGALAARWVIGISTVLAFAGAINALIPTVRLVRLSSEKVDRSTRFVQISDVHIGSRSKAFLDSVVARINKLAPEFVCITGDFIDSSHVTVATLASLAKLEVPVYFSIGNHERYEDLPRIQQMLEELGVQVLRNRSLRSGGFQFIGIDDMDDENQVEKELGKIEVERDDYVVLLYHRPRGLEAAAVAGVDLMLSGHTHGGQIIPFNLVVGRVFQYMKGLHRHDNCVLYVSTGTGTWGPIMRLGTRSEISLFCLEPAI